MTETGCSDGALRPNPLMDSQQVTSRLAGHHEIAATLEKAQIYLKRSKKDMSTLQNPPQKCHLFEALDFRTYV